MLGRWFSLRREGAPAEHPVHHDGRPCRARDRRVRLADQQDAAHGRDGAQRHDPLELLLHQPHLHAEPRRHPHGRVQPPQRRARVQQHLARQEDRRRIHARRRILHRLCRQVAPRRTQDRARRGLGPLDGVREPGRVLQPVVLGEEGRQDRPHRLSRRIRDREHHARHEGRDRRTRRRTATGCRATSTARSSVR